ncbi:hypothetical protein [Vibrio phage BONAISHI]|nr:hypothetical protein [Vibrio phage BONAISHI]
MTTLVVTKEAVYIDHRATRGPMMEDGHVKYVRWPKKDQIFFIVGKAQTSRDAINFLITGEWRDEETKNKFVGMEHGCEVIVLDSEGFVKFSELEWNDEKQTVVVKSIGDVFTPEMESIYCLGSGSPFAYGAYHASNGNMDIVYRTINMISGCTSASYDRVCRATRKIKTHKGIAC